MKMWVGLVSDMFNANNCFLLQFAVCVAGNNVHNVCKSQRSFTPSILSTVPDHLLVILPLPLLRVRILAALFGGPC